MKKKTLLFLAAFCLLFSLRVISADAADVDAADITDSVSVESVALETIDTLNENEGISTVDEDEVLYLDDAVVLNSIKYTTDGVELDWEDYPSQSGLNVLGYVIYRFEYDFNSGNFFEEADILFTEANETAILDDSVDPCKIYSYIVAACLGSGDEMTHLSNIGEDAVTCVDLVYTIGTPEFEVVNYADSIKLSWDKIPNADGYEIHKRIADGGDWSDTAYKLIKNGNTTSFSDTKFEKGTGYYYCITAYFDDPNSDGYWPGEYSEVKYIKRLTKPVLSAANGSDGVKLSWKGISGANGYTIYRDGTELATTKEKEYIDKSVTADTEYKYTVAAFYDGTYSFTYSAESDAQTITYVPVETLAPTVKLSNLSSSIKISWSKVDDADGYYIYKKTLNGDWSSKAYKTITKGSTLSYSDTEYTKGTGYCYKVSFYTIENGKKVEGDCSESEYIKRMSRPSVTAGYGPSCIKLSWKGISGANGYVIYRDGIEIGRTEEHFYNDYEIENGIEYDYTVKACYQGPTSTSYSAASTTDTIKGLILIIDAPEIKVLNYINDIYISWDKVEGASGYRIYRRTGSGDWSGTPYATVTKGSTTSYRDKGFTKGTSYYYKVTAYVTKSGSTVESEYSDIEYIKRMSRPSVTVTNKETVDGDSYVELTWKKISGADGYAVYRGDELIETTEEASYRDYNVSNGKKYQYKVRAYYQAKSKKCYSAYSAVDTIYHLGAPSSLSLTGGTKKITVKAGENSSATGIQVKYSRNANMSSSKTYKVKGRSATVSSLTAKKTYYVQVRYYKTVNGTTYYGAYTTVPRSVKTK